MFPFVSFGSLQQVDQSVQIVLFPNEVSVHLGHEHLVASLDVMGRLALDHFLDFLPRFVFVFHADDEPVLFLGELGAVGSSGLFDGGSGRVGVGHVDHHGLVLRRRVASLAHRLRGVIRIGHIWSRRFSLIIRRLSRSRR